jgi:hypothetical protein
MRVYSQYIKLWLQLLACALCLLYCQAHAESRDGSDKFAKRNTFTFSIAFGLSICRIILFQLSPTFYSAAFVFREREREEAKGLFVGLAIYLS